MPVDKLDKETVDEKAIASILAEFRNTVRCSVCGESQFTLRRVRDVNGNKTKPAEYICVECYKKDGIGG